MKRLQFYKNEKKEKGAITLFVLLACLFFMFILMGVYLSLINRAQVQEQEVQQIKDNYAKDIERVDEIYENLTKSAIVTLTQSPTNETLTREVTLIGNAKIDDLSTATIKSYIFNQESAEENQSSWDWITVSGTNVKELVGITQEGITENGSYYFWIKDSEGEVHRSNEVKVTNIDRNAPTAGTLIATEQDEDGTEGEYDLEKSPWTDKSVKIEKVDGTDGEGETETVYTIKKDGVEYEDSVTNPRTEPTTLTETGEYVVTVITTDEAGNTDEREYIIKIDKVVPILALKHNDANGADYDGSWTKDNLYGEISIDTSTTGKGVDRYQYSYNGVIWDDISSEIVQTSIDYTTAFPMSEEKPDWISGPVNNGEYYFDVQEDGTLKPSNGGNTGNTNSNTKAESYFEIDLTEYAEAELELTLNATISSELSWDFGYAEITESTDAISFSNGNEYFIKVSGTTTTADHTTTITGGKKYYLHIGYYKNSSQSSNQDTFIINSITLKSEQLGNGINFANYSKTENTVTFTLEEHIEKEIYVRAIYTDSSTSKYGDKNSIKIDKKAPIIESATPILTSREEAKVEIRTTDKGSGIRGYYISTSQTTPTESSNWLEQATSEFTIENLNTNTTYYLWVIDKVGNISERKDVVIGTANYSIDDNNYSETLEEAITIASDGSIIKLLNDYTDTSTAKFSKSVTFDIQSYTLTRSTTIIVNSGKTVEITGTGKITSGTRSIRTITNNGTLTISNSITLENKSTSTSYAPIYNGSSSAIININDNVQILGYYRGIYNYYGILNVNGGRIEATYSNSSAYGIYNYSSSAKTYITNGEIKGYYGIRNNNSSAIVEMTGGKVIGTGAYGIYANGTTNVYGGRIEGKTYGIYAYATNKLTIGRETDELSTTNPAIYGETYGVGMSSTSYSFNFYNGVLIGNTKETTYNGVVNPRTNHMPYTYFDYDVEQKYCTVLAQIVENITMEANPTEYTNGDVTVTITYPYNNDTKQYSEDGTTWQEAEQYVQEVIVTENKIVYARTLNESGVITDEEQIEITNIDKEKPTVSVSPSQTNYTVSSSNGTTNITLTFTANDTGVSGLDIVQYAWVEEGEEIEYIDFDSIGTTITKNNLAIGQYYLYFNVTDKAGNISELQQIRYNVKFGEPVCQIGSTTYTTIQAAIDACSKTAGETQTTIVMLKSTDEEFSTYEGQNIILDLKGYTVGSSNVNTPLCTNNGMLQLVDTSSNKTGKLESLNGTTIENNGTFTLGDNSTEIEYEVPTIYGYRVGIENNNIFNFYDGKIQGITPIQGNTTDTPEQYGPVSTGYENGITTIQLGIVTGYEARIEWVYYEKVQEAVDATKLYESDYRDTVTIIKDIQLTNVLEVNENDDFILDLDGYTLTISEQDRVINNSGNLKITDSNEKQTGNITIESTNNCYGIYNSEGILELAGGIINSTNYGIYNSGTIKVTGGTINSNGNSSGKYGIYNHSNGKIEITGGTINSSSISGVSYGIYNYSNGEIEITGGTINSSSISGGNYGIYNSKGIITMTGGEVNSNVGSASKSSRDSYGVYNNNGTVRIEDGTINATSSGNSSSNSHDDSYGIYNQNSGIVEVLGGVISAKTDNSYSYGTSYGIYNASDDGIINIGQKESLLNNEQPKIIGEYTTSRYERGTGLYNGFGEVNFYNGIIQGFAPLVGKITNIREGCKIERGVIETKDSIYLVENTDTEYIVQIDDTQYSSVQKAIDSIGDNDEKTIQVIKDFELMEEIEFNKNVIFDFNGYTITNNYFRIENSKNLKIINTTGSEKGKLDNNNTMVGIYNIGQIDLAGGTINVIAKNNKINNYGIYNGSGTVKITGGIINCIEDYTIEISNTHNYGILNGNAVEITSGKINCSNAWFNYGIYNFGSVKITNGIVMSSTGYGYSYGITNYGTLEVIGGNISSSHSSSSTSSSGIDNHRSAEITGGIINSTNYGIYNSGTIKVTGGTVSTNGSYYYGDKYGIYNINSLTLGTKGDGLVSQEEPYIKGEYTGTSTNYVGYGIYNTTGKFYFYDGKLEGTTKAVYDIITEYEDNTELNYNEDETVLTLSTTATPVAQIGTTTYNTLQEAINAVGNSQTTIELLRNVAYTQNDTVITIPNNKNIILDLKGYKISSATPDKAIENNGILEITDTSDEQTGTITTSEGETITNANGAKLTISGGIIENRENYIVNNSGELIFTNGELQSGYSNVIGIYNTETGSVLIDGGTITMLNAKGGIYNLSTGNVTMNSGNINMNGGTGIYNESTGSVIMTGGIINFIYTKEVYSTNYGIYNNSTGTITIGEKSNGTTSTTEPVISARGYTSTYKGYGVYNPKGTLNFYDGTIKGTTKAVYGTISELEDLTELSISSETISSQNHEVLTLQQKTTNVARVNGVEYDSIKKAIKACGPNAGTITILRDSEPGATVVTESNQNITIDLNGYTINNYIELQNKGTLKIIDSSSGQTGKIVGLMGIAISNTRTMELQSGSVADSGYGIQNKGTITINGGTISNNTYGIYNDGSGVTKIESGNITSNTYGIYNYNGTTNVEGNAITGNDYGIYSAGGTTNIKEGAEVQSDIGIYAAGGRVNIGETGTMNSSSPIVAGETYGLSVAPTGVVYMYDGQIKGKTGATHGFITYTESGYLVANKNDGEYSVDYLALAGTVSTVAEVKGVSYTNLQSAINSIVGSEPQTIKLTNGIITTTTYTIEKGQNIILDMNEKTISSDLSVTINNAGNLTIIDSTSSGVGKISSTTGTAIVNSGTLRLGQDDGTVSQDLITIEGTTYGIENTGTLNFYDGTINGGSAVNGTITNGATGYVIRTTIINGKERYYLSV